MKVIEKELSNLRAEKALAAAADLLKKSIQIGSTNALFAQGPEGLSADILRSIALELRSKKSNSVVALTSLVDGKGVLVVAVDDEARTAGVKAGALVKTGSTVLGGGGGGKDDFAQGGGVDASKIDSAFAEMKKALQGTLGA